MRIIYPFILIINICFNLSAFEISGNPKSWSQSDFLGFDTVGDACTLLFIDTTSGWAVVGNNGVAVA